MIITASIERLPEETAVVTLSGPLTSGTSLKLADSQVQAAIAGGITRMVFDMTSVEYLDSAGIGIVMYTFGALKAKNGSLRLCGVNSRVLSLLKLINADKLLGIDGSREESLAALKA